MVDDQVLAGGRIEADAALAARLTRLLRSQGLGGAPHMTCRLGGSATEEHEAVVRPLLGDQASVTLENLPLVSRLAMTALRTPPLSAQLLDETLAGPLVKKRFARRRRRMTTSLVFALLLAGLGIVAAGHDIERRRDHVKARISEVYEAITGGPSQAPGMEQVLAERYVADLKERWRGILLSEEPSSRDTLASLLDDVNKSGSRVIRLGVTQTTFELERVPDRGMDQPLELAGWQIETRTEGGRSVIRGRRGP